MPYRKLLSAKKIRESMSKNFLDCLISHCFPRVSRARAYKGVLALRWCSGLARGDEPAGSLTDGVDGWLGGGVGWKPLNDDLMIYGLG